MPLVTLTFDGGYQETFENINIYLKKFNLPTTWFIVTNSIGKNLEGRKVINWNTLLELNKIAEIGSHTHTHPLLKESEIIFFKKILNKFIKTIKNPIKELGSLQESVKNFYKMKDKEEKLSIIIHEAKISKEILEKKLNLNIESFAYPGGRTNQELKRALKKIGYKSARGTKDGYNFFNKIDFFDLKCKVWTINTSLKEANKWIDGLVKNDGWLIEIFHLVTNKKTNYFYTTTVDKFIEHINYIRKRRIKIKSQAEIVNSLSTN